MDLRQLRYFSVLAAQQHFGRAADVLHIAQPALTRQIHLLEEELGVALFERHPRGAALTEAGTHLQSRAEFLLRYAQQLRDDMLTHQHEPAGVVAIGLSPGMSPMLAVPLTLRIQNQFPAVKLRFVEGFAPTLHDMLLHGEIDLAVLNGSVRSADLVMEPLLREQMCVIGPARDARLATQSLQITDLVGMPLIMTGLAKSGVRREVEVAAARAGALLETVVEVESVDVAKRLIFAGIGLTIHFAAVVYDDLQRKKLAAVPIEGLFLDRKIARAAGRLPARATEAVMTVLRQIVVDEVTERRWPYATLTEDSTRAA
jgi:LysR family transcriptional regulator, nitrogen assimilation regulatory protein